MRLYHATHREAADHILANGFDMEAERLRDPGDFGWGTYLTADLERADALGEVILAVEIDEERFAWIEYPYFLKKGEVVEPTTEVERLFHGVAFDGDQMLTCHHSISFERRQEVSKAIRAVFLEAGYAGIITPHAVGETVIFDTDAITSVEEYEPLADRVR